MDETFQNAVRALVVEITVQASKAVVSIPPFVFEHGELDWQTRFSERSKAERLRDIAVARLNAASRALACLTSTEIRP